MRPLERRELAAVQVRDDRKPLSRRVPGQRALAHERAALGEVHDDDGGLSRPADRADAPPRRGEAPQRGDVIAGVTARRDDVDGHVLEGPREVGVHHLRHAAGDVARPADMPDRALARSPPALSVPPQGR